LELPYEGEAEGSWLLGMQSSMVMLIAWRITWFSDSILSPVPLEMTHTMMVKKMAKEAIKSIHVGSERACNSSLQWSCSHSVMTCILMTFCST